MAYRRNSTHFAATTDSRGRHIQYIHGDEGTGLCLVSVQDPQSRAAPQRILAGTPAQPICGEDLVGSGQGLTVYGSHKYDRPAIRAALQLDPDAARAVIADCVARGHAYEDGLVFEAARKALGLTQVDLGLLLGLASTNPDPAKRADNVRRSIRRYEHNGAPIMAAHALRWLAHRAGILRTKPTPR